VIDVIYAGLLKGKLHHQEKVLQVEWAAGRDVREEALPSLQLALSNWSVSPSEHTRAEAGACPLRPAGRAAYRIYIGVY